MDDIKDPVIHCLCYEIQCIRPISSFSLNDTVQKSTGVYAMVYEKNEAIRRGLKIIQEWEVK